MIKETTGPIVGHCPKMAAVMTQLASMKNLFLGMDVLNFSCKASVAAIYGPTPSSAKAYTAHPIAIKAIPTTMATTFTVISISARALKSNSSIKKLCKNIPTTVPNPIYLQLILSVMARNTRETIILLVPISTPNVRFNPSHTRTTTSAPNVLEPAIFAPSPIKKQAMTSNTSRSPK